MSEKLISENTFGILPGLLTAISPEASGLTGLTHVTEKNYLVVFLVKSS